jgi:hypothetical protein
VPTPVAEKRIVEGRGRGCFYGRVNRLQRRFSLDAPRSRILARLSRRLALEAVSDSGDHG